MIWPRTQLGRWAVALAGAHVVLMTSWRLLGPLGGFPGLVVGLAAGALAAVAIAKRVDRSATVFAAAALGVLVVLFVAAELAVGHA